MHLHKTTDISTYGEAQFQPTQDRVYAACPSQDAFNIVFYDSGKEKDGGVFRAYLPLDAKCFQGGQSYLQSLLIIQLPTIQSVVCGASSFMLCLYYGNGCGDDSTDSTSLTSLESMKGDVSNPRLAFFRTMDPQHF